jgi:hypothetical protein
MQMIFNTRKPAHLIDGTITGVANVTRGALVGTAALGVMTVVETKDRGCVGCFTGFGKGMLVAVGCTFAGVVTGIYQFVAGIINTPSAIINKAKGKEWNDETREWYFFYIEEDKKQYLEKSDE